MKKIATAIIAFLMLISVAACTAKISPTAASTAPATTTNTKKLKIVCTNFAEYDFVRQIVGNHADNTLLLKPGAESHTFEPTPADIITIQNCDLFLYVGGDSDEWVNTVLDSIKGGKMQKFKLMDCVSLVQEETVEGMQPEKEEKKASNEEKGAEMDEHVWTSPKNVISIVKKLSNVLCSLDKENQQAFQKNTATYLAKLQKLDDDFQNVVDHAARKEIIVGDRFPFRYFCEEFGLKYYAAFPGCSTDTEADASTVAFLIKKVKQDKIPVVFHIELSNEQMCASICEATGAKSELLNAVHNVSDSDFKAGVTYVDLMEHNVSVLKEALN